MKYALAIVLFICPTLLAQPATTFPVRESKYPPKTARTLHSDEQIALARANIKKYPAAAAIAQNVIKSADKWLDWKDEDLTFLLTTPAVPRAFAVSASGCPVCGNKIKIKGGDYAWIMDPRQPFKLKCPVDGTVFPSNDYESYYRSGFKTKNDGDGKYVDNGWGWTNHKTGEKFWFVAYYNHWIWHKYLVLGLSDLADAYLLTGDPKYAHKAAVMLHRIAEVYPGMDHENQSRYGEMMKARGAHYPGKVVNNIWETGLAQHVCDAYDAVFDSIDADTELQRETKKTGPQIRSFIDANFLEDAIDAYGQQKIRGNFGMHQSCLVHLALVRQTGDNAKWFDALMNNSSGETSMLGLNYALYNLVSRDGFPSESSPGYNFLWINKIASYGDLLQRAGLEVFGIPRTKRLFDGVLHQINAGQFTPDLGDAGGFYGYLEGKDATTFQIAYEHYKDPRYAAWLAKLDATGEKGFKTVDSLFKPPIEPPTTTSSTTTSTTTPVLSGAKSRILPPAKPRLLDGYGLAILNNPADTISLSTYYGQKHGHGHYDRLNFELFANGQPIMPDLGYPDAMNDFVPGIYTWSKNTISHNTVTVDAQRQLENVPGEVQRFADSPFTRFVEIEAKGTYPQCSTYRRAMIMVDAGDDQSYFVDIFTVTGGNQHDYSLHGPPGDFEMIGGKWSDPAKGTLAGENVELGQIYDDPKLSAKDYKGGFSGYEGSGFQHLFNVRTLLPAAQPPATAGQSEAPPRAADFIAQWSHEKDKHAQLRIRILDEPNQKILLADAHVSPGRYPQIIKYLIARHEGEIRSSRFVSVIEPFKDKPFIEGVKPIEFRTGTGVGLVVRRSDGNTDVVAYDPTGSLKTYGDLSTSGSVAVHTYDPHGHATRTFRYFANTDEANFHAMKPFTPFTSSVVDILPLHSAVVVSLNADRRFDPQTLVGRTVFFRNERHRTAYIISAVKREDPNVILTLTDDLLVGLAKVDAVNGKSITTSTPLPLAPTYAGTTLADEIFKLSLPVASVSDGKIILAKPLPPGHNLKPGDKVWLLNVGVGDTMEIPLIQYTDGPN